MYKVIKENEELWSLFTKEEEYNHLKLDKFGRFTYYLSSHRDIFEPKVSKYLIEKGLNIEYPEDQKFAVCLTHDIDAIYYTNLDAVYGFAQSFLHGQIINSFRKPFYNLNKKLNPRCNFKDIIVLEDKYSAKSSFFLLVVNRGNIDFNYNIEDLDIELKQILDMGCEVGLHGDREAYCNLEEIIAKKKKLEKILGKKIIGYRNHCLKFNVPDTWELLRKAGFKYDTTFGYADCVGFRNGMCHPYKPFNLNSNNDVDIVEIPLIVMDNTLFDYMNLDLNGAWKIIKILIDTVEKLNGVITILWHNTYMNGEKLRLYEKILKYCYEKNAWLTSGEEIWKWWNKYMMG